MSGVMAETPRVPRLIRALAAIDGEHLAWALVAVSDRPDWVDEVVRDVPAEMLKDALRCLAVDVVGGILGSRA